MYTELIASYFVWGWILRFLAGAALGLAAVIFAAFIGRWDLVFAFVVLCAVLWVVIKVVGRLLFPPEPPSRSLEEILRGP